MPDASQRRQPSASKSPHHAPDTLWSMRRNIEDSIALAKLEERRRAWYLIHPKGPRAVWVLRWDLVMAMALIFTAAVTPYEVALFEGGVDSLFVINRIIDILFVLDMLLQFVLIVPIHQGALVTTAGKVGYVTEPRELACRYLTGWFTVDAISILVSGFDIASAVEGDISGGAVKQVRALRVLRALRLIKLLRLARASRILRRWETRIAVSYSLLTLALNGLAMIVVAHWMACVWIIQTTLVDNRLNTWLGSAGYCIESAANATIDCATHDMVYAASLYWAVMTMSSVGYGDIVATKNNTLELWVATACMLVSALFFAQVLGSFCGITSTLEPDTAEYRVTMDALNRYASAENFPHDLRVRLREYFHYHRVVRITDSRRQLLHTMSPMLQGEVAWQIHEGWLTKVTFLDSADRQLLVEIAVHLFCNAFAPGDVVPSGYLYILNEGIVLLRGRLKNRGSWWGEDVVLQSAHLRDKHAARAMTHAVAFHIDRAMLMTLVQRYPLTYKTIRRFAMKMALRREFIKRANVIRSELGINKLNKSHTMFDMLWESSKGAMQLHVPPLLGHDAQQKRQATEIAQTARDVADHGKKLALVQDGMQTLQSELATVAAAVGALHNKLDALADTRGSRTNARRQVRRAVDLGVAPGAQFKIEIPGSSSLASTSKYYHC